MFGRIPHSGNVGMVNRMTAAARIGIKVKKNESALTRFVSILDNPHLTHGITTERTAIQKISTTKLESDAPEPTPERRNQATNPVNG